MKFNPGCALEDRRKERKKGKKIVVSEFHSEFGLIFFLDLDSLSIHRIRYLIPCTTTIAFLCVSIEYMWTGHKIKHAMLDVD